MKKNTFNLIAELRLVVGYLGEKNQSNWWGSDFIGLSSEGFLAPVFPRTAMLARYQGVSEAAMLLHDEHIGVGANFHLFRLPDAVERATVKEVLSIDSKELMNSVLKSNQAALSRLNEIAIAETGKVEGPVVVGNYSDTTLEGMLRQSASYYLRAFEQDYKCFPYMREA